MTSPGGLTFDLSDFIVRSKHFRARFVRVFGGAAVFATIAWLGLFLLPLIQGLQTASPWWWAGTGVAAFLVGMLSMAVPLMSRYYGIPQQLVLGAGGVTVVMTDGRSITWQWSNAGQWFSLVDSGEGKFGKGEALLPSRWSLRVRSDQRESIWIGQPAFEALLRGAEAAGITLEEQVSQGARNQPPAGTKTYLVRG